MNGKALRVAGQKQCNSSQVPLQKEHLQLDSHFHYVSSEQEGKQEKGLLGASV